MKAAVVKIRPPEADGGRVSIARKQVEKTFLEFFAGIGLVDEGLRPGGWRCVYANDFDERKRQMHAARNGSVDWYHVGDVFETDSVLERIEGRPFLATASFPCVDLSLAGHFRGFGGVHSSAFFGFAEVLKRLGKRRPKLVMLENVFGFLSARGGADFQAAVQTLAELGYWLDVFAVDAVHFVPQSRPRLFVVGMADELRPQKSKNRVSVLVDQPASSVFRPAHIIRAMASTNPATGWAIHDLPDPPRRTLRLEDVIDQDDAQAWWDDSNVKRHYEMMSDLHRRRIDLLIASRSSFVGTIFRRVRQGIQRAEVRFDGVAGCLRTPRGGSGRQIVVVVDGGRLRMRWMSPREYARLQGVPDFPVELPINQSLFGFADAVCVPAIQWIDRQVLTPLFEKARTLGESRRGRQSISGTTNSGDASSQVAQHLT